MSSTILHAAVEAPAPGGDEKHPFLVGLGERVRALRARRPSHAATRHRRGVVASRFMTPFGLKVRALRRERDAALLRQLLPAGLLGVGLGTVLFGVLSTRTVAGLVGALTLLFLAQRLLFPPRADAPLVVFGSSVKVSGRPESELEMIWNAESP